MGNIRFSFEYPWLLLLLGNSAIDLGEQFSIDGRSRTWPTISRFAVSLGGDVSHHLRTRRHSMGLDQRQAYRYLFAGPK